tara:strand:+ start:1021 stop:1695 length:675 start_codon:yes stop_codon:yes gene_type:complete
MDISNPILLLKKVNYYIKTGETELKILENINLSINATSSLAITGPSGSGKSSLLSIMAGLLLPTSGEVYFKGKDITFLDESKRAKMRANKVGFIFQSFELLPNLTALENILLPLEINQHKNQKTRAMHWLENVGLKNRANHYPCELSGGEQQRIAIARAFVTEPNIVFADEPTGSLDKITAQQITELLFKANQKQATTLVIVTHDKKLANCCNSEWSLVDGKIQ